MTDYGCGRCDCHHEMVDFRLRKKPRSSSGATRRPNLRLTLINARKRSGSFSSLPCPRSNRRALGAVDLESARRPDERRGPSSKTKFTCSTCGQNAWGKPGSSCSGSTPPPPVQPDWGPPALPNCAKEFCMSSGKPGRRGLWPAQPLPKMAGEPNRTRITQKIFSYPIPKL